MARRKREDLIVQEVRVKFKKELYEKMKEACKREDITISDFIRRSTKFYLDFLDKHDLIDLAIRD